MAKRKISRRDFLYLSAMTATSAMVAAQPAATAQSAPKTAPQATAAATPKPKIGASLIGKLEGPEIIMDSAKFPKSFNEAPQLAELVKAGKLPPVKERIGEEPLVVKPVHETGKYGGVLRRGFTGPSDKWNGLRAAGADNLVFWDYTGKLAPNIAKGWEVSKDGLTTTIYLRKGMKWSDGQPFTADDIMFWFEDMYRNKDLNPIPTPFMSINGKPGTVEKVDTHTVRFRFPEPYFLLPAVLAGQTVLGGHSVRGGVAMGSFGPAHYLKQFHPKYASQAELDQKAKAGKFDNWVKLFRFKNEWALNPELPVVMPWKTTSPINTPTWVLERNPYSIWVDTEGNQLPYIDKIVMTLAENLEVLNLRAIAGEYDYQLRHLDLQKLPVYLENQEKGGYKMSLHPGEWGGDCALEINLAYDVDPEIAKWLNNRDFRRALSLGVDRNQINEIFWLGTGTPGSIAPADTNVYSPGPEYRTRWATYDPKTANRMLDKLGLDKKDAEGYRLRSHGKGRLRLEASCLAAQFMQWASIAEMVKEQWKGIGVELNIQDLERSLWEARTLNRQSQIIPDADDGDELLYLHASGIFPSRGDGWDHNGPPFGLWFVTDGKEGREPPAPMRKVMAMWKKAPSVPDQEQVRLGKEIWKIVVDEVWSIGVIANGCAYGGVQLAKTNLGNIPSRQINSPHHRTEAASMPQTFFWRK